MKKSSPTARADRGDPLHLQVERVQALSADDLVLEIAADRAGLGKPRDIGRAFFGIGRVSALEIHRQRQLDRLDDPPRIGEREVDRHLLPVGPAVGVGDRMAAGRQRLRAGARPPRARCRRPRYCRGSTGSPGT